MHIVKVRYIMHVSIYISLYIVNIYILRPLDHFNKINFKDVEKKHYFQMDKWSIVA